MHTWQRNIAGWVCASPAKWCAFRQLEIKSVQFPHVRRLSDMRCENLRQTDHTANMVPEAPSYLQWTNPPLDDRLQYTHSDPSFQRLLAARSEKFLRLLIALWKSQARPVTFPVAMWQQSDDLHCAVTEHMASAAMLYFSKYSAQNLCTPNIFCSLHIVYVCVCARVRVQVFVLQSD